QKLAARRQAELIDLDQQAPRQAQSLVDVETAVEIRIVDQPLPTYSRTRLLEIDAHDDLECVAEAIALLSQLRCVLHRRSRVVDRAWSHDDDEAIFVPSKDPL